jgi:uncharacterized protein
MLDRLPEIIDPVGFAERRIELKGKLSVKTLSRLEDLLVDSSGEVEVELFFNKQGRHAFIDGSANATLNMQCQNCLEVVAVPIAAVIKLGIITALEQADRLPEGYEPLLMAEEKIVLKEIVEDELLLAVPTFPKHQFACIKFENISSDGFQPATEVAPTNPKNPFAVLAKLKPTGEK